MKIYDINNHISDANASEIFPHLQDIPCVRTHDMEMMITTLRTRLSISFPLSLY
jgi:hypothetical protein